MKWTSLWATGLLCPALLGGMAARSQEQHVPLPTDSPVVIKRIAPWFVGRFRVSGGFFMPINNTQVQVSVNGGSAGTDIDFESDLGFNSTIGTFMAGVQWRSSRRSRFDLTYYRINRSSVHTLDKDIVFGDQTYSVNTSVAAFFNNSIYRLSYGYAFVEKPKYEIGALIGLHILGTNSGISVKGNNVSGSSPGDFSFTAPVPDLGIWGGYAISSRFALAAEVDYLSANVDKYSGRIFAANIMLAYRLIRALQISLGYTGLNFNVGVKEERLTGHYIWGYNGPSLTASFVFGHKKWQSGQPLSGENTNIH